MSNNSGRLITNSTEYRFPSSSKTKMKTYHIDLDRDEVNCLSISLDTLNPSIIEDAIIQGVILQIIEQDKAHENEI